MYIYKEKEKIRGRRDKREGVDKRKKGKEKIIRER